MSANSSLLLECKGIDKNYNGPMVLSKVDFSLKRGEILACERKKPLRSRGFQRAGF